jgi:peptide deformylase
MSDRRILICGEPELRRKSKKIRRIDDEIVRLLDDLVETMAEGNGIGLAAPQIGENVRAITFGEIVSAEEDEDEEMVVHKLINPRIVEAEGEVEATEGCLSLPTLHGVVLRPQRVVVEGVDGDGEAVAMEVEGWSARAVAHEIDHLNGKLFIDRAEPDSLAWIIPDDKEEDGYRLQKCSVEEAIEAFRRLLEKMKVED